MHVCLHSALDLMVVFAILLRKKCLVPGAFVTGIYCLCSPLDFSLGLTGPPNFAGTVLTAEDALSPSLKYSIDLSYRD